jgi:hypothetical protein
MRCDKFQASVNESAIRADGTHTLHEPIPDSLLFTIMLLMGVPIQSILFTVFQVTHSRTKLRFPHSSVPVDFARSFSYVSPASRSRSRASLISPLQRSVLDVFVVDAAHSSPGR